MTGAPRKHRQTIAKEIQIIFYQMSQKHDKTINFYSESGTNTNAGFSVHFSSPPNVEAARRYKTRRLQRATYTVYMLLSLERLMISAHLMISFRLESMSSFGGKALLAIYLDPRDAQ